MTTLYLVRHGQSEANVERIFSNGRVDLPLTELGRQQAEASARWLEGRGVAHLFCAPLLRARQTAAIIAKRLGVEITILPDLDEVRVGDLDGRRDDQSWAIHDEVIARWFEGDEAVSFPGGETFGEALQRYEAALAEIAHRFPNETVAAVSHGAIQLTVLPRLCPTLGDEMTRGAIRRELGNAAITTFHITPEGYACPSWGSIEHMPAS